MFKVLKNSSQSIEQFRRSFNIMITNIIEIMFTVNESKFHLNPLNSLGGVEVELMSYNYPYFCYDYTTSNSNILVEKILLK